MITRCLRAGKFALAFTILASAVALGADSPAPSASPAAPTNGASASPIRIVNCGTQVQSRKRGVTENKLFPEDFRALAPGVSWYSDWAVDTTDFPPEGVHMDFYPQAWGNSGPDGEFLDVQRLKDWLSTHKPKVILAFNEPNFKGQCFLPPKTAADYYKQIVAIVGDNGVPVIGPSMAIGSAGSDSITAVDPITNQRTT
jgi:hypothetical protein